MSSSVRTITASTGVGYRFIHTAIDDRTRLAYGQIVNDEQAVTASEFWARAEQRPGEHI